MGNRNNFTTKELLGMVYEKLENQDTKFDVIHNELTEIKVHMKELNGKAVRNTKDILVLQSNVGKNKNSLDSINITLAKWGGIFLAIFTIISVLINKFL